MKLKRLFACIITMIVTTFVGHVAFGYETKIYLQGTPGIRFSEVKIDPTARGTTLEKKSNTHFVFGGTPNPVAGYDCNRVIFKVQKSESKYCAMTIKNSSFQMSPTFEKPVCHGGLRFDERYPPAHKWLSNGYSLFFID